MASGRRRTAPHIPYEEYICATPGCGRHAHSYSSDRTYHCCPYCGNPLFTEHADMCDAYEARAQRDNLPRPHRDGTGV